MPGLLILTTVGTSALQDSKLNALNSRLAYRWKGAIRDPNEGLWNDQKVYRSWLDENRLPREVRSFIGDYLSELDKLVFDDKSIEAQLHRPENQRPNILSAEFSSLWLLRLQKEDRVVLLLSDSLDGMVCGLINKRLLETKHGLSPSLRLIQDLQPERLAAFLRTGLKDYRQLVDEELQKRGDLKALINITGGFKSLAPYSTLIALDNKIPLYSVFEEYPDQILIKLAHQGNDPEVEQNFSDILKELEQRGIETEETVPMQTSPHGAPSATARLRRTVGRPRAPIR